MTQRCPYGQEQVEAYFDGELDVLSTAEIEKHLGRCPDCADTLHRLDTMRSLIRTEGVRFAAPSDFILNIPNDAKSQRRPSTLFPWIGGGAIGAIAASLALTVAVPQFARTDIPSEVIEGHIRSLQPGHLIDVATSDRHVVKPWFNGKINFSPVVVDLKGGGFPLVGGRLDVLDGSTAAVLVYGRGRHTINLYIRPLPDGRAAKASQDSRYGYTVNHWSTGGFDYWAVSDIPPADLGQFADRFRAAAR